MPARSFQGCASLLHFVARQTTCRHVWDWKSTTSKTIVVVYQDCHFYHFDYLHESHTIKTPTSKPIVVFYGACYFYYFDYMHESDTMRNQPRVNSDKNGLHSCFLFCPDGWENALISGAIFALVFLVQKLTIVIIVSLTWASSRSLGLNLSLSRVSFKTYEQNINFWLNSKLLNSQSALKLQNLNTCICYQFKYYFFNLSTD